MTKLCVFADSHGYIDEALNAVASEAPDMVFHLGDGATDIRRLERLYPEMPVYCVSGNCDASQAYPYYQNIKVEGVKIFATHGQKFNVKNDASLLELCSKAMEYDADVVLFGHTHHALIERKLCMDIMNPGTIGCGKELSYGVLTIGGRSVKCEIKSVSSNGVGKYRR